MSEENICYWNLIKSKNERKERDLINEVGERERIRKRDREKKREILKKDERSNLIEEILNGKYKIFQ